MAVDSKGNVYVADSNNDTIRKVTPAGVVTTLAGLAGNYGSKDGSGSAAEFGTINGGPTGVVVDSVGNVYVADRPNLTIRKVAPTGVVTTVAGLAGFRPSGDGTGSAAGFYYPYGVAADSAGNLYVADTGNDIIRKGFPANSVPAPILQPPSLTAGQFGFGMTSLSGLAVKIESSSDFSQCQVVGTYVLENGTNYFVSPAPPQGIQFYRDHVR